MSPGDTPPLPRSCQRPVGPPGPRRAGPAATQQAGAYRRSGGGGGGRCLPVRTEPAAARRGQGPHLPGSASSARGSNTAGGPPHHLLPPPWPRRRLPTAPAAPPTDTTVGAPPPSARRGPEVRRDGSRVQPLLLGSSAPRGHWTPRAEALTPEAAGAQQGWVAAAVGFVIVDSALPPQGTPGSSRPGEGRSWRRSRASAQIRKSLGCLHRRGSAEERSAWLAARLSFPDPGKVFRCLPWTAPRRA